MHCHALVFGDQPKRLMDSLIQTSGLLPADVSVPLELAEADSCSGWHVVNHDHRQLIDLSTYGYGNWVHCVWPTAFLREHLGPHALLSDGALSSVEIPRNHVRKHDGQWWAEVPRFFRAIGVRWSAVHDSSQWQSDGDEDAANGATASTLDLEYNLNTHDPNLVVGPTGPVFYQEPGTPGRDVTQRRLEATLPLLELPPSTPVALVNWHDKDQGPYDSYRYRRDPTGGDPCTCFAAEYDRPYRDYPRWDYY